MVKIRLGEQIREARKSAGLSQVELAQAAGLPSNTLARFERGELWPGPEKLDSILEALGLELRLLEPEEGEPV